ncbi:unnamed protein product [Phaedon cochleariae]|uniref:RFX-type winged-helix domain-containing protein n=1 Tax=Phaedon cochleariae TaxID=80249 RepID=A0A9P0DCK0_PHACE|nr:unnamed protein product [Phaedon cochleariae]
MENELWAADYQQSVPTILERTEDHHLNNGNTTGTQRDEGEPNEAGRNEFEKFIKSEPAEHDPGPINITISEKAKHTIQVILDQIKPLSQVEKFLLFLKLPTEVTNAVDPFRQPLNPLGSRSEIYRTISWIKTHLEEDPDISLPKQEVYNEYHNYCAKNEIKPLSQADFGKVMKQVYPSVRARRLGTRGNSRYCYAGLRRCMNLKSPILPDLAEKPMSTEAPFTQSSLSSAAWLIVKEWSEQQLNQQFPNIQSLAYHLLLTHSVSMGSEAATKISTASESSLKGEDVNGKGGNKHREMQLQLQKKIQQKNESKERKRKMQSPKSEEKTSPKKWRSQSVPTPSAVSPGGASSSNPTAGGGSTSLGECSTASSSNSGTASPAQGKLTVCDRSPDFITQLPALPDFDSFQRPAAAEPTEELATSTGQEAAAAAPTNKVAIPRLQPPPVAASALAALPASRRRPQQQAKYKSLRPRLRPHCDIASYNQKPPPALDQPAAAVDGPRSQRLHCLGSRIKERNSEEEEEEDDREDEVPDFPLTRERLESVSSVSKDAMDEYLGTNNSQHEEELSKYFSNNNNITTEPTDTENTSKISTLRLLLEQNIVDCKPPLSQGCLPFPNTVNQAPVQTETTYITPIIHRHGLPNLGSNTKRRISLEIGTEEAVPPSPNTRRKNFSFMPISPGPQSPSGMQSKCSSTTASPFVSPRNTPVVRMKTVHQNAGILKNELRKPLKAKREINLTLEIPSEENNFANQLLPMSAPVSPMASSKSVLQKLLNSTSRVSYSPGYAATPTVPPEACHFSASNIESNLEMYRSQSVPVHNMLGPMDKMVVPEMSDFNEMDSIPEAESDNVKRILSSLDNNNIDIFNLDINSSNACLQEFGLQLINNNNSYPLNNNVGYPRTVRSHSIGDETSWVGVKMLPSRSVPSTPLPYSQVVKPPMKVNYNSSRSYPSTPMNSEDTFTYNLNGDCLLNGQPIRTDCESMEMMRPFEMNDNNVDQLANDKSFGGEEDYVMVENDAQLIGSVLMDPSYAGNIE